MLRASHQPARFRLVFLSRFCPMPTIIPPRPYHSYQKHDGYGVGFIVRLSRKRGHDVYDKTFAGGAKRGPPSGLILSAEG